MKKKPAVLREPPGEYGADAIVLYQNPDGRMSLDVRLVRDTLWLTQKQMAHLFATERSVITRHLRNIFQSGELERDSVGAFFAHTASDGKTYQVEYYNLDAVISVGYRVNSKRGTQFLWFMEKNSLLYRPDGTKRVADNALVAITLMTAESKPEQKDILAKVIVNLINDRN